MALKALVNRINPIRLQPEVPKDLLSDLVFLLSF